MGAGNISGTNPFKLLTNGTVTVEGTLSTSGQYWIQLVTNDIIYKQIYMIRAATSFSLQFTQVLAGTYNVCYNNSSTAVGSAVASVTNLTYAVEASSFNFVLNFPSGVTVARASDNIGLQSGDLILKDEQLKVNIPDNGNTYYINGIQYEHGIHLYRVRNDVDIITGIQDYDTTIYTNPKYIQQLTTNILDNYKKYLISTNNTNPTAKTLVYDNGKWNKSNTTAEWIQPYNTITITSKNSDNENIELTGGTITVTDVNKNSSKAATINGSSITATVPRGHKFKINSSSFTGYNAMSQIDGYADQDYSFDYSFAGCGGTCVGECTSCTSECSKGCAGNCTGGCEDTCTGSCTGCSGTCKDGCKGCSGCSGCTTACTAGCSSCNACGSSCGGTCKGSCRGSCWGLCAQDSTSH